MEQAPSVAIVLKCPACGQRLTLARTPDPDEQIQIVCPFCETYSKRRTRELIDT